MKKLTPRYPMDFFGPFMLNKTKIYKITRFCEDIYLKIKLYLNMVKVKNMDDFKEIFSLWTFLSLPVETQKNSRKYLVELPICYKQNNSTYDITLN